MASPKKSSEKIADTLLKRKNKRKEKSRDSDDESLKESHSAPSTLQTALRPKPGPKSKTKFAGPASVKRAREMAMNAAMQLAQEQQNDEGDPTPKLVDEVVNAALASEEFCSF